MREEGTSGSWISTVDFCDSVCGSGMVNSSKAYTLQTMNVQKKTPILL